MEAEQKTQTGLIFKKIALVMTDIEAIAKDRRNDSQNYKFRGIDDVYNMMHPILAKHGVFTVPEIVEAKREERSKANGGVMTWSILDIRYRFYAEDGSYFVAGPFRGEGMDSGDKASNKAMAVAHKYALLQVFSIPTEDEKDPENDNPELPPKAPPKTSAPPKGRAPAGPAPGPSSGAGAKTRPAMIKQLVVLHERFVKTFPSASFSKLLQSRYQVGETKAMSDAQIVDLIQHLEAEFAAKRPGSGTSTASTGSGAPMGHQAQETQPGANGSDMGDVPSFADFPTGLNAGR